MNSTKIHPTAIIEKGAQLGVGVEIGPFSYVTGQVVLGDRVKLMSHVVVDGKTTIGASTHIWPFASIGTKPQDLKYAGENTELICGERNRFREYSNFSIGTDAGIGKTVIGNDNLIMANVHVAHDCVIGNQIIIANGTSLAGHITIEDYAVISGHVAFHQFIRVGKHAMISGGSIVVQDIAPFTIAQGDRATNQGLNLIGLKRHGYTNDQLRDIKAMYQIFFRSDLTAEDAVKQIQAELPASEPKNDFLKFVIASTRGLCR